MSIPNQFTQEPKSYEDLKPILEKIEEKAPSISDKDFPSFQYPNKEYQKIPLSKEGKVFLIGYGSLMAQCALDINGKETISEENSVIHPVFCFGAKRVYNYAERRDKILKERVKYSRESDAEVGKLNLIPSSTKGSFVNAVGRYVDLKDVEEAIKREIGYDLVPITFVDWNAVLQYGTNAQFGVGYAFVASTEKRQSAFNSEEMTHYTNDTILPMRYYEDYVNDAAKKTGKLFVEMYNETTYLADRKTLISKWDRSNPKDPDVIRYETSRQNSK